ncbi:unnamed protein product [Boreogadus saida]
MTDRLVTMSPVTDYQRHGKARSEGWAAAGKKELLQRELCLLLLQPAVTCFCGAREKGTKQSATHRRGRYPTQLMEGDIDKGPCQAPPPQGPTLSDTTPP